MKAKCDHRSKFSNLSNWKEVVLYGHFTPRSGLGRLGAYGLGGLGA